MTTFTLTRLNRPAASAALDLGPVLASDLPPAPALKPGLGARLREELAARREVRQFERSLALAGSSEAGDLLALRRRG